MKLLVSFLVVVCCAVALTMASPLPSEASEPEVTDAVREKRCSGGQGCVTTTVQTTGPVVPGSVSLVNPAVVVPGTVAYPYGYYGYAWGYPYGYYPYGGTYTYTTYGK